MIMPAYLCTKMKCICHFLHIYSIDFSNMNYKEVLNLKFKPQTSLTFEKYFQLLLLLKIGRKYFVYYK